jgi:DNA mismatch repair ATPase MutS
LNKQIEKIKLKINELKKDIEDDLDISKKINLVESELYTYAFEVDKKDGDNGMRKSKNEYKILSVKNRVMVFTCPQLKELVNQYLELYEKYNEE